MIWTRLLRSQRHHRLCVVAILLLSAGCSNETPTKTVDNRRATDFESGKAKPAASPTESTPTDSAKSGPETNGKPADAPSVNPPNTKTTGAKPAHAKTAPQDGVPKPSSVAATPTGELLTTTAWPKVLLTAAQEKASRVAVDGTLPPLTLITLDGGEAPLASALTNRLSVVAFARHDDPYAAELVDDLRRFIMPVYAARGVGAVVVAVGGSADAAKKLAGKQSVTFPIFADPKSSSPPQLVDPAQFVTPRIYLVDKSGKVLWFDVEYSRTTRRDLQLALKYLTESRASAQSPLSSDRTMR